jgi:hypothetical protein
MSNNVTFKFDEIVLAGVAELRISVFQYLHIQNIKNLITSHIQKNKNNLFS